MNLTTILLLRMTLNKNGINPNVLYLTEDDFSSLRDGLGSMRDVAYGPLYGMEVRVGELTYATYEKPEPEDKVEIINSIKSLLDKLNHE